MTQTTLYLMRHGECEGGNLLRGHSDQPLTEIGFAQMQLAYAKLPEAVDRVISSPLSRCRVFAEHLTSKNQVKVALDAGLKEVYFGRWDGQPIPELHADHGAELTAYWQDPWANPLPEGEPMAAFEQRVDEVVEQLVHQHSGEVLLLITHGGVIRHLMAKALGVERAVGFYTRLSLDYASVVKVSHYRDKTGESFWRLHWHDAE
ncbi:histidine phosphatase family protein [Shewanella aquimarina]|uniref:histidine phosphatase family protein n=1 Tax=Shewanella aquimarina TaxID=260365 RepID=UPI002014B975|nr:histidine phosphatase family protein [Shewanella aquimarina]MCL2909009.1 histidine phosphatase family protein [Shewanella aquimarina]